MKKFLVFFLMLGIALCCVVVLNSTDLVKKMPPVDYKLSANAFIEECFPIKGVVSRRNFEEEKFKESFGSFVIKYNKKVVELTGKIYKVFVTADNIPCVCLYAKAPHKMAYNNATYFGSYLYVDMNSLSEAKKVREGDLVTIVGNFSDASVLVDEVGCPYGTILLTNGKIKE